MKFRLPINEQWHFRYLMIALLNYRFYNSYDLWNHKNKKVLRKNVVWYLVIYCEISGVSLMKLLKPNYANPLFLLELKVFFLEKFPRINNLSTKILCWKFDRNLNIYVMASNLIIGKYLLDMVFWFIFIL